MTPVMWSREEQVAVAHLLMRAQRAASGPDGFTFDATLAGALRSLRTALFATGETDADRWSSAGLFVVPTAEVASRLGLDASTVRGYASGRWAAHRRRVAGVWLFSWEWLEVEALRRGR